MQTEEEQVEKLKSWLRENGMAIVFGVVIGIGGLGGYRFWVDHRESQAEAASNLYAQMIEALNAGNHEGVASQAERLIGDYPDLEYATLARFALARSYVEQGQFDIAREALQQVVGSAGQDPLGFVARTRLAMVQMQLGQFDQALATLAAEFPPEFSARVEELRGDIYRRQGNSAQAIEAYRRAQQADPPPANGEFLRQKIDNLGATG